jgi:hypothetical protein
MFEEEGQKDIVKSKADEEERWIIFLDAPLLDSTSDYGKCNILF